MDSKEIKKTFTWEDARSFTWDQLLMDKLELLKKAASEDLVLPDPVYEKLISLCRKTIEDYNEILPNQPLNLEANDLLTTKLPYSNKVKERLILFAISIIEAIVINAIASKPQTTNNYYISVEQCKILQTDANQIAETLSNTENKNLD